MAQFSRPDGRQPDQMRPVKIEPGIAPHAAGSVLCSFGDTQVICAASLEKKVPTWMLQQQVPGGWLTAEYSMLPYSTLDRKQREIARGKADSRNIEIQRLIGRSLRAVVDLQKLPGHTLWIDCDVLRADGGTRTASITGAYVAAKLAVSKFIESGALKEDPIRDAVVAISVGVYHGVPCLDLNYPEDRDASVDANIVMTGSGQFVEVQGTGEEATFSHDELLQLLELAKKGCQELAKAQVSVLLQGLTL